MQETWDRSLGQEDPLVKEMATHLSTFAWKIPWTEEPGRRQSMGSQRVGHDWVTSLSFIFHYSPQRTWAVFCFCFCFFSGLFFPIRRPPGGHRGENIEGKDTGRNGINSISCPQPPIHKLIRLLPCLCVQFLLREWSVPDSQEVRTPTTHTMLPSSHSSWILSYPISDAFSHPGGSWGPCPLGFWKHQFHP